MHSNQFMLKLLIENYREKCRLMAEGKIRPQKELTELMVKILKPAEDIDAWDLGARLVEYRRALGLKKQVPVRRPRDPKRGLTL